MKKIEMFDTKPKANIREIEKLEKLIESKLPQDYSEFLMKYNGGRTNKTRFPLIEPIEDDYENGCDFSLGWFYAVCNEPYCNLGESYKNETGVIIPKDFLIINDGISGHHYICLGIKGPYYGELYLKASDNYLYKIANNFTDFINSFYQFDIEIKENSNGIMRAIKHILIYDCFSLPLSTHVKKYGIIITNFFAQAPKEVEDYIIEETESSKDLLLWYEVKSTGKKYYRKISVNGEIMENFG